MNLYEDSDLRIVDCVFYDGGIIKTAFAKRARGMMARFVCTSNIKHGADSEVEKIKAFDYEGYKYSPSQSSENFLVFTRPAGYIPSTTVKPKKLPDTGQKSKRKMNSQENESDSDPVVKKGKARGAVGKKVRRT